MRMFMALIALCVPLAAQDANLRTWRWSIAAISAASAADAASSLGMYEINPVLGRGSFGPRQMAVKGAALTGTLAAQTWLLRKHPRYAGTFAVINYISAGAFTGAAVHNFRER